MINFLKNYLARRGLRIVTIFSILYSFLAAYMLLQAVGNIQNLFNLNLNGLNKLGSFLAGAFSPLAFLWLLIGYKLQEKGFKDSLAQTKLSQDLNEKQFKHQKETTDKNNLEKLISAQPKFSINKNKMKISEIKESINIEINNHSENEAFNFCFLQEKYEQDINGEYSYNFEPIFYNFSFKRNSSIHFDLFLDEEQIKKLRKVGAHKISEFKITYSDKFGNNQKTITHLYLYNNGLEFYILSDLIDTTRVSHDN